MRRKVIQLAGKTLVVSLPSKWVKKQSIVKGQELEILESEQNLLVSPLQKTIETKTCLDVSELNSSLVWHYVVSAYVKGIEEIEVRFSEQEIFNPRSKKNVNTIKFIADIVAPLIGMEVVRHGSNFCVIKEVSSTKIEEFNGVLKRLFFTVCTISSDCLNAFKDKDWQMLANFGYLEDNVNRLFAFCARALNKGVCTKNTEVSSYQSLIACLEEIGDAYAIIVKMCARQKHTNKQMINFLDMLTKTNVLVHQFSELFYDFDKTKCALFYDSCRTAREHIELSLHKEKNAFLLNELRTIQDKLMSCLNARIVLAV